MNIPKLIDESSKLLRSGNIQEAKNILLKILKKNPKNILPYNMLISIHLNQQNKKHAYELALKSVAIEKKQPQLLALCAEYNYHHENYLKAQEFINLALNIDSNNSKYYFLRARILSKSEETDLALASYFKTIELDEFFFEAYINIGEIYNQSGQYDKAIDHYLKTINKFPNQPDTYYNLGVIYNKKSSFDDALNAFEKVLALNPNYRLARLEVGFILLRRQNFEKGWKAYESRFDGDISSHYGLPLCKKIDEPQSLLVWGEQGIGDHILFSSLLDNLKKIDKVTVAVEKRIINLLQRNFKDINFIDLNTINNFHQYDFQIPIASLGEIFRGNADSFKNQPKRFLKTNSDLVSKFKKQFSDRKSLICGISWKSSSRSYGVERSINLDLLGSSFQGSNIYLTNLQYGDTHEDISYLRDKFNLEFNEMDSLDKFNDIEGLSALMDACDIIITADNVTVHLAGALGKKTYLILPKDYHGTWYWHDDKISRWYPSVEIFRFEIKEDFIKKIKKIIS